MTKYYLWGIPVVASSGHGWEDAGVKYEINNFANQEEYVAALYKDFYENEYYSPHDEGKLEEFCVNHEIYDESTECPSYDGYTNIYPLRGASYLVGEVTKEFALECKNLKVFTSYNYYYSVEWE